MYSFYLIFFLFFFLFILLILFSVPYTHREIIPGLGSVNYGVRNFTSPGTSLGDSQFTTMKIFDGEGGSAGAGTNSAIDFGGSGIDVVDVGFVPTYLDSKRELNGFFKLFVSSGSTTTYDLVFRVVDITGSNTHESTTLKSYNKGWASLTLDGSQNNTLHTVIVPFSVPEITTASQRHELKIQIATTTTTNNVIDSEIQLNSASVYYY